MKIIVRRTTDDQLFRDACESTLRPGMTSKVSFRRMLQCEHSPIRVVKFWAKIEGVKTKVSVHLVRHHSGVDAFVMSNRSDRGGEGDDAVTRSTPINHGTHINAQALISMSRKRLCLLSDRDTVATWTRLRKAIKEIEPDMADFMVPECVYRNGLCPELRMCEPGVDKVCIAYPEWPGTRTGERENG